MNDEHPDAGWTDPLLGVTFRSGEVEDLQEVLAFAQVALVESIHATERLIAQIGPEMAATYGHVTNLSNSEQLLQAVRYLTRRAHGSTA